MAVAAAMPARAADPITIGFSMAQSGPLAVNGKSALLAMQIWQDDVNAKGGLLGHWSVWTQKAVALLDRIHKTVAAGGTAPPDLLALDSQVTDCNAAVFDVANRFHGCIAGIHEVLRRQGLLAGRWCLNPSEDLSPGQAEEIGRVAAAYPHLTDDDFVRENLQRWLS